MWPWPSVSPPFTCAIRRCYNPKMPKNTVIILTFIILGAGILAYYLWGFGRATAYKKTKVLIGSTTFNAEIADTLSLRMKGLSGRRRLADNAGMLFIFPTVSEQSFWMKDMNFPIDIIWILEGKVIGIEKDVATEPGKSVFALKSYPSPGPIDQVLEINAGLAERYGIKAGDAVRVGDGL